MKTYLFMLTFQPSTVEPSRCSALQPCPPLRYPSQCLSIPFPSHVSPMRDMRAFPPSLLPHTFEWHSSHHALSSIWGGLITQAVESRVKSNPTQILQPPANKLKCILYKNPNAASAYEYIRMCLFHCLVFTWASIYDSIATYLTSV